MESDVDSGMQATPGVDFFGCSPVKQKSENLIAEYFTPLLTFFFLPYGRKEWSCAFEGTAFLLAF
jgi:hypothetical protein